MGYCKDVITLVAVSSTRGTNGYKAVTETSTKVYADKKSVTRSEFYEALRSGVEPTVVFELFTYDYANQKYVDYDGVRYKVVRAYSKGDMTQLNCTEEKSQEAEG